MFRDWLYLQWLRFDGWRNRRKNRRWNRRRAIERRYLDERG